MRAVAYYEQALERDPDYAPAHAGIALSWGMLGWANVISPDSAWPRMREAAERAWALNRDLPEVRLAAALKKRHYDWDWGGTREEFEQAIALNPSYADALAENSWFLSALGDHERAVELARRASQLEPNDPRLRLALPWALGHADRFDEAMDEIDALLEDFPGYGLAPWYESHMYTRLGRYEDAVASMRTAMGMMQPDDLGDEYCLLAYLYAKLGRPDGAWEQLAALDRLAADGRYISPVPRSFAYIALEDHDRAMELLTEAYETRAGWIALLPLWREWLEPLESRQDFMELADRLGFPNWP
jgi:serine/threonine-protein kinase